MMTILATISLLLWLYLSLFHGRFWHSDQILNIESVNRCPAPSVVCVIPARDEAESIAATLRSLLDQDYPGDFSIILVDDNSTDGTVAAARAAFRNNDEAKRVQVLTGAPLPAGWVGKMWAVSQGIAAAGKVDYLLLTDADIVHAPGNLSRLVGKAEADTLGLVSLMVKLRCVSAWERLLIPAFVYFFQKLYPFPRVNDPASPVAAAAGGCMLVDWETLQKAGGIKKIRDRVIDDCALAGLIKPLRPIWLGLSEDTHSSRSYEALMPIWNMVARTAYVQLNHNPLLLAGTLLGMVLLYLIPPLAVIAGLLGSNWLLALLGGGAWLIIVWTCLPALELYRANALWAFSLPFAGILYALMTLDSARRHYAGKGGAWKGRTYP
ncbi:MAG: glycosyltransferase [Rhodospirillales bacterium]|nr:glycosyltransferase [Rhodospirillales bacterium]